MKIIPLHCPNCGQDLPGLPYDKVFYCSACNHGYLLDQDKLKDIKIWFIKPLISPKDSKMFYLPFWLFRTEVFISPRTSETERSLYLHQSGRLRIAATNTDDPKKGLYINFFIPAFRAANLEVGLKLTRKRPKLTVTRPQGYPLVGMVYDSQEAKNSLEIMVRIFMVISELDIHKNTIRIDTVLERLLGIPYHQQDIYLKDLTIGASFQKNALTDLKLYQETGLL